MLVGLDFFHVKDMTDELFPVGRGLLDAAERFFLVSRKVAASTCNSWAHMPMLAKGCAEIMGYDADQRVLLVV